MDTMEGLHRSQYCAEVSEADNGKEVVLSGWVERRRDHGGLIFIDLRDRTGIVQVVASPDYEKVSFDKAEQVRTEYVLAVRGIVRMRGTGQRRRQQGEHDKTFFHNVSFKKQRSRPRVMLLMKLSQPLRRDMRINLGRREIAVAKQHLDHT